jgi:hypothetical protein
MAVIPVMTGQRLSGPAPWYRAAARLAREVCPAVCLCRIFASL